MLLLSSQEKTHIADILCRTNTESMIFKAKEDFKTRTLSALPTLLEKLAYICTLQTPAGDYRHWGMARVFGEGEAQNAIEAAHLETATELIRVPIREIYTELVDSINAPLNGATLTPETLVLRAPANDDGLLAAHLRLIQDSVAALVQQDRKTTRVA